MQLDKALLDAIGVSSERVFGYLYAGTLTVIVAWLIQPGPIERLLQAAGPIVALLILLGAGSGVFGAYLRIFGNLALFPLTHWIHRLYDRVRGRTELDDVSSSISYLRLLGVVRAESAYIAVKDSFDAARSSVPVSRGATPQEVRFFHAHGEVHFLYLTTLITLAGGLFVDAFRTTPAAPWFAVAAGAWLSALIADIILHSAETVQMRNCQEELREFLYERHYVDDAPAPHPATEPAPVDGPPERRLAAVSAGSPLSECGDPDTTVLA